MFGSPAFWWLDYYAGLRQHLRSRSAASWTMSASSCSTFGAEPRRCGADIPLRRVSAAGRLPGMGRALRAAFWAGPAAALWGLLAVVARIQTAEAAAVTNVLVALALPVTYIAVLGAVVQASARPRLALMRATALTFGLLVTLAVMELAAAARLVHWELFFKFVRGEQQHYVPDPDLGFRHAPNVRWSGRPRSDVEVAWGLPASRSDRITVTYDGRGYRNATALDRADIVLIGDSYVEGGYVSDDQVVSRFLQDRLGRPVANLGVAGYGTAQELVVLKRDAMPLAPRVVIWFFFEGNDLYNDQDFENAMLAARDARSDRMDRRPWMVAALADPQRPCATPPDAVTARGGLLSQFRDRGGRPLCRTEGPLRARGGLPVDGLRAPTVGRGPANTQGGRDGHRRAGRQAAAGIRSHQVPRVPGLRRASATQRDSSAGRSGRCPSCSHSSAATTGSRASTSRGRFMRPCARGGCPMRSRTRTGVPRATGSSPSGSRRP